MHEPPPTPANSASHLNAPSYNHLLVRPSNPPPHPNFYAGSDRPPPNFHARLRGPPPFSNVNPMLNAPPSYNHSSTDNCHPPQFYHFNAGPNGPPPRPPFNNIYDRPPPPPVDIHSNNRPFQTNLYSRPQRPPTSDPFTNSFNRPPFPHNFNDTPVRPPRPEVCFDARTQLPPPNANCRSGFKTNVTTRADHFSNIGHSPSSNFNHRQLPPVGSLSPRLPNPSFLPSTSNGSFPTTNSCQPTLPISTRPLENQQTIPFQSFDCFARPLSKASTPQHPRPFHHDGAVSPTRLEARPSCNTPPPSRSEKIEGSFSTPQIKVASASAVPFHPLHRQVISFKKDQEWVNKWLEQRAKLKTKTKKATSTDYLPEDSADSSDGQIKTSKAEAKHETVSKLSEVHGRVAKYRALLEELRQCHLVNDEEKTESVKVELEKLSSQLLDPSYQTAVQRLVTARRKKRVRARRSRQVRQERWEAKSRDMDRQRELLCCQYKQEETQKRLATEADAVLREVRGKKEETVALQLLLAALRDLRQHRLNKGEQQGYVATHQHTKHFDSVTGGLDEMLESQLQDYELEERTLQAMLDQQRGSDQLNKIEVHSATSKDTVDPAVQGSSLREVLFGCAAPADPALFASYTAADASREMLLSRRLAWDQHLVEVGGSGIPISWVTPPEKASEDWEKWKEQS